MQTFAHPFLNVLHGVLIHPYRIQKPLQNGSAESPSLRGLPRRGGAFGAFGACGAFAAGGCRGFSASASAPKHGCWEMFFYMFSCCGLVVEDFNHLTAKKMFFFATPPTSTKKRERVLNHTVDGCEIQKSHQRSEAMEGFDSPASTNKQRFAHGLKVVQDFVHLQHPLCRL